jgi:hypothetical protein
MMKLSKAGAQRIQAEHIEWYGRTYGLERVGALVMAADRSHLLTDGEHDVVTINRFIPRGGAIENLIPEIRDREAAHQARLHAFFAGDDRSCDGSPAKLQPFEHDGTSALDFIAGQGGAS